MAMQEPSVTEIQRPGRSGKRRRRSKKKKTNYKKIIQYAIWIILIALFIASVAVVILDTKTPGK